MFTIKRFSQRNYIYEPRKSEDFLNHYTIPKNVPSIIKTGLKPGKWGLSFWPSHRDVLYGQDFNELNSKGLQLENGCTRNNEGHVKNLQELRKYLIQNPDEINNNFPGFEASNVEKAGQEHLVKHGLTSYIYNPNSYHGMCTNPRDPVELLGTMDGLHAGNVGKDLTRGTPALRKTRNPVRISVEKKDRIVTDGSDARDEIVGDHLEKVIGGWKSNEGDVPIPASDMKIELPNSGIGTRDTDIKKLRRYMKGHKKLVNANRETMKALYGEKWPHLNKFPE